MTPPFLHRPDRVSRRAILAFAAAGTAGTPLAQTLAAAENQPLKGRIKHSVVQWCFNSHWDVPKTIEIAASLGCQSVELIDPRFWPDLKKAGLTCAIAGSHGFVKGFNNPDHWPECEAAVRKSIEAAAEFGCPSVITFTGMRDGIPDDVGATNCVAGLKRVVGHAEKHGVTVCLEMLNSRDDSHPMKGHPGYQGDHTDYCVDIIRKVGSPRLKLLFDVYHVQIMDGDVIRRIRQHAEFIGHVHTAGNPGRAELDDTQEIQYAPIMRALVDVGYTGYVGHEFIPTRDPLGGLKEAIAVCDV
jgi:hydroxypyruvate isomerase